MDANQSACSSSNPTGLKRLKRAQSISSRSTVGCVRRDVGSTTHTPYAALATPARHQHHGQEQESHAGSSSSSSSSSGRVVDGYTCTRGAVPRVSAVPKCLYAVGLCMGPMSYVMSPTLLQSLTSVTSVTSVTTDLISQRKIS